MYILTTAIKFAVFMAIFATEFIEKTHGHGNMVVPNSWFDTKMWVETSEGLKFDYVGMKSGLQCFAGCRIPSKDICPASLGNCGVPNPGCSCLWFNNYTFIKTPTLFDPRLRTYPLSKNQDKILHTPWRAPGAAYIDSPCGVGGGNINGCGDSKGKCIGGGYIRGPKAEKFNFKYDTKVTNWTRGSVVEAVWSITANHGGGYSYRLCKLPEDGVQGLTEECFQQIPLKFFGSKQWIQYGEDLSTRQEFQAERTNVGTFPEGSQWTKNPIPACNSPVGGLMDVVPGCPKGPQFPPPIPGVQGYGFNIKRTIQPFKFSIVDKLIIPKSLEPGNYVLSFRWDCEQTPQVWNTCASINLE